MKNLITVLGILDGVEQLLLHEKHVPVLDYGDTNSTRAEVLVVQGIVNALKD